MTPFERLMLELPPESRCIQTDQGTFQNFPLDFCFFGVPPGESYGRAALERMPAHPSGAAFLLAGDQFRLLDAFVTSGHGESITRLMIGCSSYGQGSGADYSSLMPCLIGAEFPALRTLQLGIWELFCNSHEGYGVLGDITETLQWLTQVRHLELYGYFELHRPLELPQLKRLEVSTEGNAFITSGQQISPQTLTCLLTSWLPEVERLSLLVRDHAAPEVIYPLPDGLIDGTQFPVLRYFESEQNIFFHSGSTAASQRSAVPPPGNAPRVER